MSIPNCPLTCWCSGLCSLSFPLKILSQMISFNCFYLNERALKSLFSPEWSPSSASRFLLGEPTDTSNLNLQKQMTFPLCSFYMLYHNYGNTTILIIQARILLPSTPLSHQPPSYPLSYTLSSKLSPLHSLCHCFNLRLRVGHCSFLTGLQSISYATIRAIF